MLVETSISRPGSILPWRPAVPRLSNQEPYRKPGKTWTREVLDGAVGEPKVPQVLDLQVDKMRRRGVRTQEAARALTDTLHSDKGED